MAGVNRDSFPQDTLPQDTYQEETYNLRLRVENFSGLGHGEIDEEELDLLFLATSWRKQRRWTVILLFILAFFGVVAFFSKWWAPFWTCCLFLASMLVHNGRLAWRKLRRPPSDPAILEQVAPNIPAALVREVHRELSYAGDLVCRIPVFPDDRCSSYKYNVSSIRQTAKDYGLEPPSMEELGDVRTVGDLLILLESCNVVRPEKAGRGG